MNLGRVPLLLVALAWCIAANAATWSVDGDARRGQDNGPGTDDRPLLTLAEAMRRITPGDTVLVADGVYRETVVVPKLSAAQKATTIRARNPGQAVIRGSDVVTGWRPLDNGRFEINWAGRPEPAQVFMDGVPLRQIAGTVFGGYPTMPSHELAPAHASEGGIWLGRLSGDVSTLKTGDFIFDAVNHRLVIRLASGVLPGSRVEVATRPFVLLAEGVDQLRLEGLVFEHANTSHLARQGAVKVFGDRNVLANITIRRMDAIGLQLFGTGSELIDSTIEDCGQMGLNARGRALTVARNRILRNNTRGFNKWWEAGGMKMIGEPGFHDSFIRDNVVAFNRGDGIWIDWMNTNVRISGNVAAFNEGFGIHYEASQRGWIDGNAAYGNTMRGIYVFESSDTRVERNVVLANRLEGVAVADGERSGANPALKPRGNSVVDNVIGWNGRAELMLPHRDIPAVSNGNVLLAGEAPKLVQGWTAITNWPARGLREWRRRTGLDTRSIERISPIPPLLAEALQYRQLLTINQLQTLATEAGTNR